MTIHYDGEQISLDVKISELQCEIEAWNADIEKSDKFLELVKRYTEFYKLTNQMVNEFIEKIIVHEAEKIDGKREQRVDIHLNFIGKFEAPIMDIPLSEKEISELEKAKKLQLEKLEAKRAKQRERNRKYREAITPEKKAEYLANRRAKYVEKRTSQGPYKPHNNTKSATA